MSFIILLLLLFFILFNLVTADAKAYNILSSSLDYIVSTDLPNKNVFVVMIGSSITNYLIYDNTGSVIKELTELKTDTGTTAPSYTERNNLKAMNDSFVVLAADKNFHFISVDTGTITKSVQWIISEITSSTISLTINQSKKIFGHCWNY